MTPCLNWREIAILASKIQPKVESLFVDRIIVPTRDRFPQGYLKGEWIIRLTGKREESSFLVSIRPRHPYFAWSPGKGPRAATQGTRSPFDLTLSKNLKGSRLIEVQPLERERVLILWFSSTQSKSDRFGLVLVLIPAAPEAFLVSASSQDSLEKGWPIIARSRTVRDPAKIITRYHAPDGSQAPANPVIREELIASPEVFYQKIESELAQEAFETRVLAAHREIRQLLKHTKDRLRQSETALVEANHEEDWQKLGDSLKSVMHDPPPIIDSKRNIPDYETGEIHLVPCDPKLTLQAQVEKFYQNAKRKLRRLQEAQNRADRFQEAIQEFEKNLKVTPAPLDWAGLSKLEQKANLVTHTKSAPSADQKKSGGKAAAKWTGKIFFSGAGNAIYVGRSKDENLELTFKVARGNDLWLHVRGRPGAHTVIPLQPGKSASLETLLDAAALTIYYSGGEKWGKTEVDYTFKKYVKRIKDSSEASYTNNKTLLVEPDPVRLKRLLEPS